MYLQYKTLTKLTKDELERNSRSKSTHASGDEWMNWAIQVRAELDKLDAQSAEWVVEDMKNHYQTLKQEVKQQQIRAFLQILRNIACKKRNSIKLKREAEDLFRWTGILYVPGECEVLTKENLEPYMNKVTVLHLHTNIKYIDAQVLKKCPKLKEIDFLMVKGNDFYEVWNNQLFDNKTNERLWP